MSPVKTIEFGDISTKAELGDSVSLQVLKDLEVVKCEETGALMLNIDATQIQKGDLPFIKKLGLTISNPDTEKPIALGVDYLDESWGHKISDWLKKNEDEDDSSFFNSTSDNESDSSFLGGFGNGGFSGGFSGGFGGFGGGSSVGGGASSSF